MILSWVERVCGLCANPEITGLFKLHLKSHLFCRAGKVDAKAAGGERRTTVKLADKEMTGKGGLAEKHVGASSSRGREGAGKGASSPIRERPLHTSREVMPGGKSKDNMQRGELRAVAVQLKSDLSRARQEGGKETKKNGVQAGQVIFPRNRQDMLGMRQEVQSTRKGDASLSKAKAAIAVLNASNGGFGKAGADGDGKAKATGRGRNTGERQGSELAGPKRSESSAGTDGAQPAGLRGGAQIEKPPAALHVGVAQQERQMAQVIYTPLI